MNQRTDRDRGTIVLLALIITVVLSLVVIALATYASTTIRFGDVAEGRADRLSAAEGGMRDVVERLAEDGSLCTTAVGAGGVTLDVVPDLNGAEVEVDCQAVGGTLSSITSWAVVVTGQGGVPDDHGLETQSGASVTKVFGGPTYVERTDLLRIAADLEIRGGNLWYTDGACEPGGEYISDGSTLGTASGDLTFDPPSRGVWCTSFLWSDLFNEPSVPNLAALTTRVNAPYDMVTQPDGAYQDLGGCRVFLPGRYDFEPPWAAFNYMKSGDYLFDLGSTIATAEIEIQNAIVTAGREGVAGDQQEITNGICDAQRDGDVAEGATFYLDGATHFVINSLGSLEILRRAQGTDFVSIHALPTHDLGTTYPNTNHGGPGDTVPDILSTWSGNQKQMAIHGAIWAPNGTLAFGEVTNTAAAQLLGGAVVAALRADASASASGLVIQVQGSPQSDRFRLTANATKDGLTTRVQVIAQLRFSAPSSGGGVGFWELAVNSWRVCEIAGC